MKYPQLIRIPSEVSEWLEEQLEQRGIDAIVYTRYVLSLLLYSSNGGSNSGSSDQLWTWQGMRRRNSSARNISVEEAERQRRLAAVNCLVAASDHPHHIESLVDELCDRLKRMNSDTEAAGTIPEATQTPTTNTITPTMNRHDLARRYYAAFPALKRHGREINLATPPSKHRYTNGKDAKRLDYATATMKKRQMVFQRPPGIDRNWFITSRLEDWHTHNTSLPFTNNGSTDTTVNTPNGDYMINDALALDIVRDILDDSNDIYIQPTNYCYSSTTNNFYQHLSFNTIYNNKYITNGTNIITSIWSSSEDDVTMGWVVDKDDVCLLQKQEDDGNEVEDDGIITFDTIDGYLDVGCRWSEAVNYENQMLVLRSLEMLNHSQEFSGFNEVIPKSDKAKSSHPLSHSLITPPATSQPMDDLVTIDTTDPEEDLLHSTTTHFRPITPSTRLNHQHIQSSQHAKSQYADGTTFYVSCTLDTLSYELSEDGATMWLDLGDDGGKVEYMSVIGRERDENRLELKFRMGCRRNDKACQTMIDEDEAKIEDKVIENEVESPANGRCSGNGGTAEFFFPGDLELLMDEEVEDENDEPDDEYVRSDDNCIMEELFGKFIETEKCDKCSTNATTSYLTPTNNTSSYLSTSTTTNNQLKSIWDAGELCVACLRLNAHSSGNGSNAGTDIVGPDVSKRKENNQQQEDLRYDVTKDGEELLSDLSSIQNRYMLDEERMSAAHGYYYGSQIRNTVLHVNNKQYDYPNELTTLDNTANCLDQSQNHHHHPMLHSASFSFASRLQEDCLIKMATMPTLRSVTL